uniref:Jerky protein homolog-like n=2 Tax=Cacopsylla melanoneura TaxID=428564 RepID=A0A8D8QZF0_9HEMI
MPRKKRQVPGTRGYRNYSDDKLAECVEAIRSKTLTQRAAEKAYGISRSTIKAKLKGNHNKSVGRQKIFSEQEETSFVQHMIKMSDFGFPMIEMDFRFAAKAYLGKRGVKIPQFRNNLPGYDWAKAFIKRHKILSTRVATNIKKSRAAIFEETINEYMGHLQKEIEGIPPASIWNFDETNLTDDSGSRKVIAKRGAKYIENICNSSKSATSLMFCANAEGKCLPPYVVYKAEHMWSVWTENGPPGARYNRSASGWFDGVCFQDWFESSFLPEVRNIEGVKVVIGDNLSSHINPHVLELCSKHNVCLPPHSTHLTQPFTEASEHLLKCQISLLDETHKITS